jgi:hypothetical protein
LTGRTVEWRHNSIVGKHHYRNTENVSGCIGIRQWMNKLLWNKISCAFLVLWCPIWYCNWNTINMFSDFRTSLLRCHLSYFFEIKSCDRSAHVVLILRESGASCAFCPPGGVAVTSVVQWSLWRKRLGGQDNCRIVISAIYRASRRSVCKKLQNLPGSCQYRV